jgi:hypothetical protein
MNLVLADVKEPRPAEVVGLCGSRRGLPVITDVASEPGDSCSPASQRSIRSPVSTPQVAGGPCRPGLPSVPCTALSACGEPPVQLHDRSGDRVGPLVAVADDETRRTRRSDRVPAQRASIQTAFLRHRRQRFGVRRRRVEQQMQAGGGAGHLPVGERRGDGVDETVTAAPILDRHPPDVPIHLARGKELRHRRLVEDTPRKIGRVLRLRERLCEVLGRDQPAEAQARRQRLLDAAAVDDDIGSETLQGADRCPVIAKLGVVVVLHNH